MAEKSPEKICSIWQKLVNPLRNLNTFEIERILQNARLGMDVKLQSIFSLIEQQTPIFNVCLEKRCAGLQNREWDILPIDDTPEARLQADKIKLLFEESDEQSEDSLTDAIRHLQNGAFRGRAYVKPFIKDGKLVWKKLENWNVLRAFNKNWWNPSSDWPTIDIMNESGWASQLSEIPKTEVCYTLYERPIDIPGLMIYLRLFVGETKYALFMERQGLPLIVITAPDGTPDSSLGLWNLRAVQLQNGGSGVMPSGAQIQELTAGRGQDPFTAFIQHLNEMICILAVGGALNTLGGATGLGSDLASLQNNLFLTLISQDAKKIQNTITHIAVEKACKEVLNQKRLCKFAFVETDDTKPSEYLDLAMKARDLGCTIDIEKLRDLTKLLFISLPDNEQSEIWSPEK